MSRFHVFRQNPMTPLRQRFIEDMQIRNYSRQTVECYVYRVACFAKHFGRSPTQLGREEIRQYQVHLVRRKKSPGLASTKQSAPYGFCTVSHCPARGR